MGDELEDASNNIGGRRGEIECEPRISRTHEESLPHVIIDAGRET